MDTKEWAAYQKVIDFLRLRKRAYQITFQSPKTNEVLKDLARFCRANTSCFHSDPRVHAVLEGRREVWLRIADHLNLQPDQLYEIYNKPTTLQPTEKE